MTKPACSLLYSLVVISSVVHNYLSRLHLSVTSMCKVLQPLTYSAGHSECIRGLTAHSDL